MYLICYIGGGGGINVCEQRDRSNAKVISIYGGIASSSNSKVVKIALTTVFNNILKLILCTLGSYLIIGNAVEKDTYMKCAVLFA